MNIEVTECGAVKVLRPVGVLRGEDAARFHAEAVRLLDASLGRCVVDASGLSCMDSAGLTALLDASDRMAERGSSLRLCGLNSTVREVLELTGLAAHFDYFEDVNSAVRSCL
jgi:anti-anti-sigma factor